ncbi:hypothetical protein SDC9_86022 [bioreactor metagenome]|uniref:Uncharacterized protein n=1 Tax=bioreactor metagenome TaxID=1076179 RepID=A0A644ZF32_9ZZZZ|nr:hypothetical protein [Oscillospiraceae bacterium]
MIQSTMGKYNAIGENVEKQLKRRFENLPVGILITDSNQFIIYKNQMARKLVPNQRIGSRFREKDELDPTKDLFGLYNIDGISLFCCARNFKYLGEGCRIVSFMSDMFVDDRDFKMFAEYAEEEAEAFLTNYTNIKGTCDFSLLRAYINKSSDNLDRVIDCKRIIKAFYRDIITVHPDIVFPCLLSEVKNCFLSITESTVKQYKINLKIKNDPGIILMVNFKDLLYIMINIFNYCLIYSIENEIELGFIPDFGYEKIKFSFTDKNGVFRMFKTLYYNNQSKNKLNMACFSFLPLMIANAVCAKYGHEIEFTAEDGLASVIVRVPITNKMPELRVRSGDEISNFTEESGNAPIKDVLLNALKKMLDEEDYRQ